MSALRNYATQPTPQTEALPGRDDMKANNAGGVVFTISLFDRLDRFLVLGSEGGTYYVGERDLTVDTANVVIELVKSAQSMDAVDRIIEVSESGRAPKNDQALFALALAATHGDLPTRSHALENLRRVARTGTHFFQFVEFLHGMRGWGRMVERSLAEWYTVKTAREAAFQAVKYRQRQGWSHRDVLRICHPVPDSAEHNALFGWITQKRMDDALPQIVRDFADLQKADTEDAAIEVLRRNKSLSFEMVPSEVRGTKVWTELLPRLPMTALLRNLPTLTRRELLKPMGDNAEAVATRLTDPEALRKARVHPLAMLIALMTYARGQSLQGEATWTPNQKIVEALDEGYHQAFHSLDKIDKRVYIGIDCSGSMGGYLYVPGNRADRHGNVSSRQIGITYRQGAAAMAMVFARQATRSHIVGFTDGGAGRWGRGRDGRVTDLGITASTSLRDAVRLVQRSDWGGTDCALPMLDALEKGIEADAFVVITDNETWAGQVHPSEALKRYRNKTGIDAKLIVVGMVPTEFSIADPDDVGMLDVVGFDAAVPKLIQDFIG